VAVQVLHKLENIEERLRAIEAQNRRQRLWDSIVCCAGPAR